MATLYKNLQWNPGNFDNSAANHELATQARVSADLPPARAVVEQAQALLEAEQSEVGQYFIQRQQRLQVVTTTTTRSGQVLDWIDPSTQGTVDRLAPSPPLPSVDKLPSTDTDPEHPEQSLILELEEQPEARGPAGTVPVPRKNLAEIGYGRSLQDFLSKRGPIPADQQGMDAIAQRESGSRAQKQPDMALLADPYIHMYANSGQSIRCFGGEGAINLWNPYVEWSDEFSLGQIAIAHLVFNVSIKKWQVRHTVEAGWQVCKDFYGDWQPHLFVYYTTNGYASDGDNIGGYNQDVDGWVQVSNTQYPTGRLSPISTLGGLQSVLRLKYQLFNGNWWLRVGNEWIGYYPAMLFGTTGLRTRADSIAFYGEITNSKRDAPKMTQTDMGSGHWPYEGWQKCAYMRSLFVQVDTAGGLTAYKGVASDTNSNCYHIESHFDSTSSWQSYCWWGGSGRNGGCP
jgi:hypothetical protein